MSVGPLVALELGRAFTRRGWLGIVGATAAIALITVSAYLNSTDPDPNLSQAMSTTSANLVVSVLAILLFANDVRHSTLSRWVVLVEDRRRLIGAKVLAATAVGAGVGVVSLAIGRTVGGLAGLESTPVGDQLATAGRTLATLMLVAVVALTVAVLARGIVAPFVIVLALAPLLESLFVSVESSLGDWLPLSLVSRLISAERSPDDFAALPSLAILLAWAVLLAAAAIWSFERRDLLAARR